MKRSTVALIIALIILALACAVGWIVAIERGATIRTYETTQAATAAAEKAKEKKADEIQNTPADRLVDASPRADELKRARDDDAANRAARILDEIRLRSREAISGGSGGPVP